MAKRAARHQRRMHQAWRRMAHPPDQRRTVPRLDHDPAVALERARGTPVNKKRRIGGGVS